MEVGKVSGRCAALKPLKEWLNGFLGFIPQENYYRIDLSSGQKFYAAISGTPNGEDGVEAIMVPVLDHQNNISTDLGNPTVIDVQWAPLVPALNTISGLKIIKAPSLAGASLLSVSITGTFRDQAARAFDGVDKRELSAAMDEMLRLERCIAQQNLMRSGLERPAHTR